MEGKTNTILFLLVVLSVAYGHPARARDVRMSFTFFEYYRKKKKYMPFIFVLVSNFSALLELKAGVRTD